MTNKTAFFLTLIIALLLCGCTPRTSQSTANSNSNSEVAANVSSEPAGTPASGGGESDAIAASAVVTDLYKQHDAKKSPFFQTKDRSLVDKFFTKRLGDLIWKDAKNSAGTVGAIDADPLYNAQDIDIKNFAVGAGRTDGDTASVVATFSNFGSKQSITFQLKRVGTAWKIDDIGYGDGDSLMKWLKDVDKPAATSAVSGEFEGKYTVGETTCIVKPVKMAFEIKWAKGSGTEVFFYKDANVFQSDENSTGGRNEFRFDDENYNTGTFVRADGKIFPVKRG